MSGILTSFIHFMWLILNEVEIRGYTHQFAQVTFPDIFSIPHFLLPARAVLKGLGFVCELSRTFRRSGGSRYGNDGAVPFRGKNAEKIGATRVRWAGDGVLKR